MGDESKRREYVLNDVGKIYIGSHSRPKGRRWVYGQVGLYIQTFKLDSSNSFMHICMIENKKNINMSLSEC